MATAAPELPVLARDQAFESLYRRYLKDVYHYALALLRNPADAEDVTQTTFMNAYRALQNGEQIEKPHNWLIKIAHNAARSRYARASRRVKEVPLDDHLELLAMPEEEKPDVRAVLEALGRLPLNQRAALVMRELEGRTYSEIADTLDVSVPAVETLLFRARRSLRLRASAIRALAAVPVPTSLAQLFETGGTAVLGGGALVGTGFLVKAAVAVVAGVVATSLGGSDHSRRAVAAAKPATEAMSVGNEHGLRVDALAAASIAAMRKASHDVAVADGTQLIKGDVVTTKRSRPAGEDGSAAITAATGDATAPSTSFSSSSSSAAPSAPSAQSTTAAASSTLVDTVSGATTTVSSAVPPVTTTPSVPSVTVPLPPPPPLPKLP